jgi:hypothetical protein
MDMQTVPDWNCTHMVQFLNFINTGQLNMSRKGNKSYSCYSVNLEYCVIDILVALHKVQLIE